jgi:hypothetical protein
MSTTCPCRNSLKLKISPSALPGSGEAGKIAGACAEALSGGNRMHLIRPRVTAALAAAALVFVVLLSAGASAQSTVSGFYKGNGKPAALTQVVARKGEPESGKPVTDLVFSTKDQAGDAKPAFNALFGKFGDAIVVKIFADGKIYSVDLVHSNLDAPGGSIQVFGGFTMKDFAMAGGEISGHLSSGGEHEVHGQKWDVDLTFRAKAP